MTGYGLAQLEQVQFKLSVEIKTLNSKSLDLGFKMPSAFYTKEIELRQLFAERLERGKINVFVRFEQNTNTQLDGRINQEAFKSYYKSLSELAKELDASQKGLFTSILQLPDVIMQSDNEMNFEVLWQQAKPCFLKAIADCDAFRVREGSTLKVYLQQCLHNLNVALAHVVELAPARLLRIRERLLKQLEDLQTTSSFDNNRLEQELIFYVEKLDISEEISRLRTHLALFEQCMLGDSAKASDSNSIGRKLGFIAQEIGREINTIGAKANDAAIQHDVVGMKEELEKIKEQLANVL